MLPPCLTFTYVMLGLTATATLDVSVHGVVVQTRRLSPGRSRIGILTVIEVWATSR
jgi:hypothetical protein